MKNIEKIVLIKRTGKKSKSLIKYSDGTSLVKSYRFGIFALRQYIEENNILEDDYQKLIDDKVIKVYRERINSDNFEILSATPILNKIEKLESENKYLNTTISSINFKYDPKKDEVYTSIKYDCNYKSKKKSSHLTERVELDDAIYELIDYAKENGASTITELFENDFCTIDKNVNEDFKNKILPQIEKRYSAEKEDPFSNRQKKDSADTADTTDKGDDNMDIESIDFILENGKNYAIVNYKDGEKTLSLKEINTLIEKLLQNNETKELFRNPDFISYYAKKGRKYYSITKKQYITNNKSKIGKIVVYQNEKNEKKAMLFLANGEIEEITFEEAINACLTYAKDNKIDVQDDSQIEKLFKNDVFVVTTEKELNKNFQRFFEESYLYATEAKKAKKKKMKKAKSKETKKEKKSNLLKKLGSKIINKLKNNKLVRRITLVALTFGVVLGGYKLSHKSKTGEIIDNTAIENTTEDNYNAENVERPDYSYYSFDELLENCTTNENRKNAMTTLEDFLLTYNDSVANSYTEENNDAKLVHTVEEANAMYLLYNDLDAQQIYDIYGNTAFDKTELTNNFSSAQYQDTLAHNIQTDTLGKSRLLINDDAKKLYEKYENIFINMNQTDNYNEKVYNAQKFYSAVREDFNNMTDSSYENIPSYKIMIKEFIDSMLNINLDIDNKLTDDELNYINGFYNQTVENKASEIATMQTARSVESTIDYGDGSAVENDLNPYYSEFKDALVDELTEISAYYTTDENRNVDTYTSFDKNINLSAPKESEPELGSTKVKENKEKKNDTIVIAANVPTENVEPAAPVEQEQTIEPVIEGKISKPKVKKEVKIKVEDYVEPSLISDEEGPILENEEIVVDKPPIEPVEITNTGIDEITPDQVTEIIDDNNQNNSDTTIIDSSDTTSTDTTITDNSEIIENPTTDDNDYNLTIDQDKQDGDGNLNDQYTDISTIPETDLTEENSEVAKTNEEIVDELIEQMAQEDETYDDQYEMVYTK